MTALVLKSRAVVTTHVQRLRMLLARLGRAIDATVSALAAHSVPDWRMQEVQSEIARYRGCSQQQTSR